MARAQTLQQGKPFYDLDEDSTKWPLDSNRTTRSGMTFPSFRRGTRQLLIVGTSLSAPLLLASCDLVKQFGKNQDDKEQLEVADPDESSPSVEAANPEETSPKDESPQDSTATAALAGEEPKDESESDKEEELAGPPDEHRSHQGEGAPHPGPWIWVTRSSAAIYKNPNPKRKEKLGYVKRGGQVPILDGKVEGSDCPRGWYKVASGGYICSHVGTTDKTHRDVKFRPNQPNIDEILPYLYVRNAHNGTPLYKSIPSREQTYKYEPYLPGAIEAAEKKKKQQELDRLQMEEAGLAVGGASGSNEDGEDDETPLWEREENLHEVTMEDLRKDSDEILAARMMKGFYVAVDKTFKWDGRTWYKTTKGLIAPADRFWATAGSDFQGTEIDGEEITLPLGWVINVRQFAPTYEIDTKEDKVTTKGKKLRHELVQLKYRYHRVGKTDYFQMKDGDWIRDRFVRMTTPGPRPAEVGPNERWIDVDISEQTLVVFEGDRPVYATLISSGKESRIKEKDHSTPRGMWRVREKHIASTMDGDGSAAGDLPYSIEDVPYIMYFHKSYATHGAFWHRNYGTQMSHGCVNLAPLDAKWVFYYADPQLPEGFHGNWSREENKGSMVVVHD